LQVGLESLFDVSNVNLDHTLDFCFSLVLMMTATAKDVEIDDSLEGTYESSKFVNQA